MVEHPWTKGGVRITRAALRAVEEDALAGYAKDEEACGYLRGPAGAQCYSLSPAAAAALLAGADRWLEPVDLYMDRFWEHGVACKALMPYQAFEMDQTVMPSSIGARAFHRRGIAKWRREFNRAWDDAARFAYNLTHG